MALNMKASEQPKKKKWVTPQIETLTTEPAPALLLCTPPTAWQCDVSGECAASCGDCVCDTSCGC